MMCVICQQRDEPCWKHGEECQHLVFRLGEEESRLCVACGKML